MNQDFVEMLSELSAAGAEFIIVGAHALAVHGLPRATGDLDIWIRSTPENAGKVWKALTAFGAPLDQLSMNGPFNAWNHLSNRCRSMPYRHIDRY